MATTAEATRESAKEAGGAEAGESAEASVAVPKSGGGLKPWLPLIVTVVTMPLLAFGMTRFVLLPRMTRALGAANLAAAASEAASTPASATAATADSGKTGLPGVTKVMVP